MVDYLNSKQSGCCTFEFPDIPVPWLLFIDFAFTFGTSIVYCADIVTDIITLKMYFERGWIIAFYASIGFIVLPSILLAILEFNFLKKTYGKSLSWKTITLRTVLNVPFQLTIIWYHIKLSYTYLNNWMNHIRGLDKQNKTATQWYDPTTLERSRGASLSSLNELDFYQQGGNEVSDLRASGLVHPPPHSAPSLAASAAGKENQRKENWWEQLTREQWLSHLNKLKLSESMLESLPQLLINLYLIAKHRDTQTVQYISAVLSYLSLCGGVVRYDKTRKDNEADRWMVDRTLLHSRVFYTRLEWPQILFVTLYKGSFLAARILAFVFFTLYFGWFILIPILLHWGVLLCYLVYRWYPDFNKVTRQLQQADYKYRAYMLLSHDFMSVFLTSLMGIFIHVRPYYHTFLDQPYCFMFWYYVAFVAENAALFLAPGIVFSLQEREEYLNQFQYYVLMATDLILNVAGCALCVTYYLAVHKMRAFTAHAYPAASRLLCRCCIARAANFDDDDDIEHWLPVDSEWTVCKQAETSEIFYLTKSQLRSFRQTYNTMVRQDRFRGRTLECFIDDRCRIFYAPRSKMKKMKTLEVNSTLPRPSLRLLKDPDVRVDPATTPRREDIEREDMLMEERLLRDRQRASGLLDDDDDDDDDGAEEIETEPMLDSGDAASVPSVAHNQDKAENKPEVDGRAVGVRFTEPDVDHLKDQQVLAGDSPPGRPVPKIRTKSFQKSRNEVVHQTDPNNVNNGNVICAKTSGQAGNGTSGAEPRSSRSNSSRSGSSNQPRAAVRAASRSSKSRRERKIEDRPRDQPNSSSQKSDRAETQRSDSRIPPVKSDGLYRTEAECASSNNSSSRSRAEDRGNRRKDDLAAQGRYDRDQPQGGRNPRGAKTRSGEKHESPRVDGHSLSNHPQSSTHTNHEDITNELPGWQQTWI